VVEHLAPAARLAHDPAAAKEEAGGFALGCGGEHREMAGVVPPVVVVEPANELTAGAVDRRGTCVDLAAALVRDGRDPRVVETARGLDAVALAVVDDDRLPAGPVLLPHARERTAEQSGTPAGRNDHGEMYVDETDSV
jgi:hypothetical protein